jgi:secondary thiamine-phosphate synthase enzyme
MIFTLDVATADKAELKDVTKELAVAANRSGIKNGVLIAFVPHTTAGITINENADPTVREDILASLERMVPWRQPFYQHAEGNSAAHVKAALMGAGVQIALSQGRLVLGTWQGVFFCEFDGPRQRKLHVTILEAVR